MKNQKGFSLIELMIVVAIIGILTAMAVPNFQRFQLKSKQAEAKNTLASFYTASKAFQQEWSRYYADFNAIGFAPEGRMIYHMYGGDETFGSPSCESGYVATGGSPACGDNAATVFEIGSGGASDFCNGGPCTINPDHDPNAAVTGLAGVTTAITFTAFASSDLDQDGANDDQWSIDHQKTLTHVNQDID